MKKIYLACPFSDKQWWVRWYRTYKATKCAAKLMEQGYIVFSPLTHSVPVAWFLPKKMMTSWDFWKVQDFSWLDSCDALVILTLPGWRGSTGVNAEWKRAAQAFKLVKHFHYDTIMEGRAWI